MNCVDYLLTDHIDNDKEFIVGRSETVTFSGLAEDVMKFSYWIEKNIGIGKNIILISPNDKLFVISYLAVMKSGNVVVPLNPTIEKSAFQQIVDKCESECVIGNVRSIKRLNVAVDNCIDGDVLNKILIETESKKWENSVSSNNQLAQIIFTSGSTAQPKGVMISHQNIIANTKSIIEYLQLTSNDIMEVVLPFFYCYGLSLLHTHLKVGGSIVLNNNFIFLGSIIDDLKKYKCTGFAGVPSHFQILLRKSDSFIKADLPDLKYVTQAGGKLHSAFIEEFCRIKPDTKFYVMYGQTEATARLSYLPPERLNDKLGSLGKGIPDVELKVVNEKGESIKKGEVGEIIAKGENIMLGYYKEPQETAKTIKNGWLYTGDLATIDEDGFIFHSARKKEIIKVGGRRISPKEVEEVIVGIDGVIDCTIEAAEDSLLGEAIKATLVIDKSYSNINEQFVKEYCASQLSSYKIPKHVSFSNSMNVNAVGKKIKGL